ncbi:MAG: S-methyl-5-thioribose-1-phosphate isomerase [Candidatus Korarchaeota archaeon]
MKSRVEIEKIAKDIKELRIQGARNIAIAAVRALELVAKDDSITNRKDLLLWIKWSASKLIATRPTEPTLRNFVKAVLDNLDTIDDLKRLREEVVKRVSHVIEDEENSIELISIHGARMIEDGMTILTHCHSSTVVEVLKRAWETGKRFRVISTETRPLFQGRKTAKELAGIGIPTTQIVDSAVAYVMPNVDMVIVGSDAISAHGALANKIGTKAIAIIANYHGVPFYVASSTYKFDFTTMHGHEIEIEERDPSEVATGMANVEIRNPAFDITPAKLITGIITEKGIIEPGNVIFFAPRYEISYTQVIVDPAIRDLPAFNEIQKDGLLVTDKLPEKQTAGQVYVSSRKEWFPQKEHAGVRLVFIGEVESADGRIDLVVESADEIPMLLKIGLV